MGIVPKSFFFTSAGIKKSIKRIYEMGIVSMIRVENLPGVTVSQYAKLNQDASLFTSCRPFTILFVKPYQPSVQMAHGPALGVLTLIAVLRKLFGGRVRAIFRDMKVYGEAPEEIIKLMDDCSPDVVAVSALNIEAVASHTIASICKKIKPSILMVLGGPYTLRQTDVIFSESSFDWVFEGASDRSLPQALARHFNDFPLGDDISGFSYRDKKGCVIRNNAQDLITDLDDIPIPAWDLHDFDAHRKRDKARIITNLDERRYAYLFTSRGCPYLCNYCHDVFTKRFVYQSRDRIIKEIALLHDNYGVREFHFVDDIFNLHRPHAQEVMNSIAARWGKRLFLAFPNGLRGDILDKKTIDSMVSAGAYNATISIETVTPRLQQLVEKGLDIDKAKWAIKEFDRQGVVVHGSFMYGFPTETLAEIKKTLSYAIKSPLLHAHFFTVVPQRGTPIYDMAMKENQQATIGLDLVGSGSNDYNGNSSWYQLAYGYPLRKLLFVGMLCFYFYPPRMLRFLRIYRMKTFIGLYEFLQVIAVKCGLSNLKKAPSIFCEFFSKGWRKIRPE